LRYFAYACISDCYAVTATAIINFGTKATVTNIRATTSQKSKAQPARKATKAA